MAVKLILNNAGQNYLTYNMFREQSLKEKHKLLIIKCINMTINKGSTVINMFPEITIPITINIKVIAIPIVNRVLLKLMH